MKFEPFNCPSCGKPARGTEETLYACAEFETKPDGSVDYSGYTEVWWDSQMTTKAPDGKVTLVCACGEDWLAVMTE